MNGAINLSAWLDNQGIAEGVRACEMIGSLLTDGPQAAIKDYSDKDWATVGDVGFEVCSEGPEAIRKPFSWSGSILAGQADELALKRCLANSTIPSRRLNGKEVLGRSLMLSATQSLRTLPSVPVKQCLERSFWNARYIR